MSERPVSLVLVAGTATEVGKTWVAASVLRVLRADGVRVAARKPAQSFAPGDVHPTDAEVLGAATGEDPRVVCPAHRCYAVAMAPPMAAAALELPSFRIVDLVAELRWPPETQVGVVETAGGARSPLADDGDAVTLAAAIEPDHVLLVADAGLGTINAVRSAMDAFGQPSAPVDDAAAAPRTPRLAVLLNRFDEQDDLHRRNREWLAERDGYDVHTTSAALGPLWHPR